MIVVFVLIVMALFFHYNVWKKNIIEVNVIHIFISERNEIGTIEINEKDYCFQKENTFLKEYMSSEI